MKYSIICLLLSCVMLCACTPSGPPERERVALCTHRDCFEKVTSCGVTVRSARPDNHDPATHSDEPGIEIYMDGTLVYYSKTGSYENYRSKKFYPVAIFGDRNIMAIPVHHRLDSYFTDSYDMLMFDTETLERLEPPDIVADCRKIQYDPARRALDMSAFAPSVLAEDCAYEAAPLVVKLNPRYEDRKSACYFLYSNGRISGTRAKVWLDYPFGCAEIDYVFENNRFSLKEIRVDQRFYYSYFSAYEPVPGKVLNVHERRPGDGREPEVTEEGVELELGGEILGFYPDVRLSAAVDDIRLYLGNDSVNNYMKIAFLDEMKGLQRVCYFNLDAMEEVSDRPEQEEWWYQLADGIKAE